MKIFKLTVLSVVVVLLAATYSYAQTQLKIGAKAPMLTQEVEDISGRTLTMEGVAQQNGLLVIFSCNTCPWVLKWEDRYPVIADMARANNVGLILLNSNEDYRDRGDSMEDMIKHAKKAGYNFPYAVDKNHEIADAFGATRTPHVYLFNDNMELEYVGAIDDNANDASAVKEFYLRDAINQMVADEEITTPTTKSLGCTIKRVS